MSRRAPRLDFTTIALVCVLAGAGAMMPGCGSSSDTNPGIAGAGAGAGGTVALGGATVGGSTSASQPCVPAAVGLTHHDAGNYDHRSCNVEGCHADNPYVGGWVYATATGVPWVEGATVTITNSDGTKATAVSDSYGFFVVQDKVTSSYTVCVSKCPSTDCSLTPHTSTDCQKSGCHGDSNLRIYVTQGAGGMQNAGGASSGGASGQACKAPTGGPYVHSVITVYSGRACVSCHSSPAFVGGYLYDGVTSSDTVAQATITLTPNSGEAITAVTGPEGMFFFGTVGAISTPQAIFAPYTACVSKCSTTICSDANSHTTTDDCATSGCHDSSRKVYLQ